MSIRTFVTAAALSAAIVFSGAAIAGAAEATPDDHCASRIKTVNALLAGGNRPIDIATRSIAERDAAYGAYLHEQGNHTQAHSYLDFAIGQASFGYHR
jgi:hypothetical protein